MKTETDVRRYFSRHITILKYLLYWPIDQSNYFIVLIHKLFSFIKISTTVVLYIFLQFVNVYKSSGNVSKMIESSLTVFTNLNYLVKMITCIYYNEELNAIMKEMSDNRFQPKDIHRRKMILGVMSNWNIMFHFYMGICFVIASAWAILPFIKSDGQALPFGYWYPFDVNISPVYEIIYAYELLGILMIAVSHVTLDAIMAGYLAFISAQIVVLNDVLSNLNRATNIKRATSNNSRLGHQIRCILLHRKLKRIVEKMNEILAVPMFVQSTLGSVILCLALYKLAKVRLLSAEGFSYVNYYIAMLFQLSIYFWYGNEILWKSDELSKSAYQCNWVDTDKSFKQNLLFFMLSTNRTLKVYGGHYIILSLNPLITIIKFSWSCFTLLKSV